MQQPYMPSAHFGQIGGLRHPIPSLGSTPPQSNMTPPHRQPAIDHPNPPPVIQGFQRPQLSNQISQPGPPMSLDFARGPAGPLPQFRHPTFSNQGIASPTGPQMQPMNFSPAPNHVGSFPPRVNSMPLQQNNPNAMLSTSEL
ncbi:hypothetical protein KY290_000118 [Solanum tuberosum]|uniref:Uncharacterized protein n=1 Tax=Solanum tuberosum TaxID=4113 RepID=A0ABQ7WIE6_SOLTU|nr:hypothetical protein KY290_000118 [Solanum tuberosum]